MGALLMTKTPGLELHDVARDEYSMEKISQSLIKYVIDSYVRLKDYVDGEIDEVHDHYEEIE